MDWRRRASRILLGGFVSACLVLASASSFGELEDQIHTRHIVVSEYDEDVEGPQPGMSETETTREAGWYLYLVVGIVTGGVAFWVAWRSVTGGLEWPADKDETTRR